MFYLWKNIKGQFKKYHNQLKNIFFALTKAYKLLYNRYNKNYSKNIRILVENWLQKGLGHIANKDAKDMPIINLLKFIRKMITKWNCKNRREESNQPLCLTKNIKTS